MALREEKKQQTRQALIDAALTLMHEGAGFSGLSLREVSRQAGLVPTGFYRHFPDMEALGLELASEACLQLRNIMREVRGRTQGGAVLTPEVDFPIKVQCALSVGVPALRGTRCRHSVVDTIFLAEDRAIHRQLRIQHRAHRL